MFKDISAVDAQNPIVGSLLKELEFGKKRPSKYTNKRPPSTVDFVIQSRLNALTLIWMGCLGVCL